MSLTKFVVTLLPLWFCLAASRAGGNNNINTGSTLNQGKYLGVGGTSRGDQHRTGPAYQEQGFGGKTNGNQGPAAGQHLGFPSNGQTSFTPFNQGAVAGYDGGRVHQNGVSAGNQHQQSGGAARHHQQGASQNYGGAQQGTSTNYGGGAQQGASTNYGGAQQGAAYSSAVDEPGMPYGFQYDVNEYGNVFGHSQSSDGTSVTGRYYVRLPDGRLQTVDFRADPHSGYTADVQYEGQIGVTGSGYSSGASTGPGYGGGVGQLPLAANGLEGEYPSPGQQHGSHSNTRPY